MTVATITKKVLAKCSACGNEQLYCADLVSLGCSVLREPYRPYRLVSANQYPFRCGGKLQPPKAAAPNGLA